MSNPYRQEDPVILRQKLSEAEAKIRDLETRRKNTSPTTFSHVVRVLVAFSAAPLAAMAFIRFLGNAPHRLPEMPFSHRHHAEALARRYFRDRLSGSGRTLTDVLCQRSNGYRGGVLSFCSLYIRDANRYPGGSPRTYDIMKPLWCPSESRFLQSDQCSDMMPWER